MVIELKIPQVGESITEVQLGEWLRPEGSSVKKDEPLVVIETDKVTIELPSPADGTISRVLKHTGDVATVGEVIGLMEGTAVAAASPGAAETTLPAAPSSPGSEQTLPPAVPSSSASTRASSSSARISQDPSAADSFSPNGAKGEPESTAVRAGATPPPRDDSGQKARVTPAARRILDEHGLRAEDVLATGPGGRVVKSNVLDYVERREKKGQDTARRTQSGETGSTPGKDGGSKRSSQPPEGSPDARGASGPASRETDGRSAVATPGGVAEHGGSQTDVIASSAGPLAPTRAPGALEAGDEEIVPMSPLRRRIAERLLQAQSQAALLTTFNEIEMSAVMAVRRLHGPAFQEKYGIKLGFMSFFVKSAIEALKLVPGVNAEVRGESIVYRNHYDIGVAVGGGRGLVVPVLRRAERMSFAEIEIAIHDFAVRARENRLELAELQGGTFTISNGGIYGSMLSTPIVNPPQSGILGMHAIQERPVAREGQVLVRPMMYVALTYDHRIVDGREAVTFLVRIKECIEDPARMLLEV